MRGSSMCRVAALWGAAATVLCAAVGCRREQAGTAVRRGWRRVCGCGQATFLTGRPRDADAVDRTEVRMTGRCDASSYHSTPLRLPPRATGIVGCWVSSEHGRVLS